MLAYHYFGTLETFTMVIRDNNLQNGKEQSSMLFPEWMDLCKSMLPITCVLSQKFFYKHRQYLSNKTNTSTQKM